MNFLGAILDQFWGPTVGAPGGSEGYAAPPVPHNPQYSLVGIYYGAFLRAGNDCMGKSALRNATWAVHPESIEL